MSRTLTSSMSAEMTAAALRPVLLYEGVFNSGTLRFWTGVGDLSWNASTWTGAGNLMAISPIEETSEVRAVGIEAQMSGLPSEMISLALTECRYGKSGKVWFGALTASGTVVADPFLTFSGKLDVPKIQEQGNNCIISISYESRLIDLQRSRERRYTNDDQHIDYSTDRGFEYVADLQDKVVPWGASGQSPAQASTSQAGTGTFSNETANWDSAPGGG